MCWRHRKKTKQKEIEAKKKAEVELETAKKRQSSKKKAKKLGSNKKPSSLQTDYNKSQGLSFIYDTLNRITFSSFKVISTVFYMKSLRTFDYCQLFSLWIIYKWKAHNICCILIFRPVSYKLVLMANTWGLQVHKYTFNKLLYLEKNVLIKI